MDANAEVISLQADPAAFGFSDATHAYLSNPVGDPNSYVFWDIVHPTARAQGLLSDLEFVTVTPEPGIAGLSVGLVVTAAGITVGRIRRRAKRKTISTP